MRQVPDILLEDVHEANGLPGSSADAPKAKPEEPTSSPAASVITQSQPNDANSADQRRVADFRGTDPQTPWPHEQIIIDAAAGAEVTAIGALESVLLQESEWAHLMLNLDAVVAEVRAARTMLEHECSSITASADALLAIGRGVRACPQEGVHKPLHEKLVLVENSVRDVVVWRCQQLLPLTCLRHQMDEVLTFAFGNEEKKKDNKVLYSRLWHAHRHVVSEKAIKANLDIFKSNSQEAAIKHGRTRPKRPRRGGQSATKTSTFAWGGCASKTG